jgi:hypothetical protein
MSQNIMDAISLVAIGLDGTLLTSAGIFAPQSAVLLTRTAQRGVHVILATTRLPESVQAFCRQLDLHHPFICLNGAQIWGTPEGPVWASSCIPQEVALAIAQVADTHNWDLSITIGTMRYRRARLGQAPGQVGPNRVLVSTNAEAIIGEPGRILIQQPEAIEPLRAFCHSKFSRECHTETYSDAAGVAGSWGSSPATPTKGRP